jgi:hypothetical protein
MKDDIAASGFAVAVSPDAAKIFYTQGDGLANRIMSYDVETRRESEVARGASSGRTSAIAVSPDGQRIVFAFGRKLLIVPALGGPSREIEIGSAPGTSGGVEFYGTAVRKA